MAIRDVIDCWRVCERRNCTAGFGKYSKGCVFFRGFQVRTIAQQRYLGTKCTYEVQSEVKPKKTRTTKSIKPIITPDWLKGLL